MKALAPIERKWLNPPAPKNTAQSTIAKFGGQTALARLLGRPQSSIQCWAIRRSIPEWWHTRILILATKHGIALSRDDF